MPSKKSKDYIQYFHRGRDSTKQANAGKFKKFCLWSKNTPEDLIAEYQQAKEKNDLDAWERETTNKILEYYNVIQKEGYKINYCNTLVSSVLAFHHQNTKVIEAVFDNLAPTQLPTEEYRFKQDDLRKCFYYGDTTEKALLSLGVSLGWGSKDFLNLESELLKGKIEQAKEQNQEFVGWIHEARRKTGSQPRAFLTPEAIQSIDAYLQLLEKKHGKLPKYLFPSNGGSTHLTNEGLNKKLRRLVEKANIKTHGKHVRFHLLRKFTYSRLRRIDRDFAKIICAKSISVSDMTYEEIDEQAFKVFKLAYKHISLNGDILGKAKQKQAEAINKLQNAITELQQKLVNQDTINEAITKKNIEQDKIIKDQDALFKSYEKHTRALALSLYFFAKHICEETENPKLKQFIEELIETYKIPDANI